MPYENEKQKKGAVQTADRKRHKDRLKSERRKEPTFKRLPLNMLPKPSILIVCEGKNIKVSYFEKFRVSSAVIQSVRIYSGLDYHSPAKEEMSTTVY